MIQLVSFHETMATIEALFATDSTFIIYLFSLIDHILEAIAFMKLKIKSLLTLMLISHMGAPFLALGT